MLHNNKYTTGLKAILFAYFSSRKRGFSLSLNQYNRHRKHTTDAYKEQITVDLCDREFRGQSVFIETILPKVLPF